MGGGPVVSQPSTATGMASVEHAAWELSSRAAALPVIWSLLGRHIAFHRRLVDLTDSVKAALLLSQSIYWTRRGRDVAQSDGWFHKTTEQWAWETGLSPREQSGARDALKALAIVEERRLGVPARVYFRLNLEQLGGRLCDHIAADPRSVDWYDMVMVAEMLGPSVAYHRALAGIGGGVHAGLLLSRALYRTRLQVTQDLDAWICNSAARWFDEIGLTRREQENARRDLVRTGIWEEALRGIPPSLVARIRLDCLLSLLTTGVQTASDDAFCTAVPVCVNSTSSFARKGETSLWQPHIHVSTKPPSQFRQKRHPSIYTKSTSETVQPQHTLVHTQGEARAAGTVDGGLDCGGELIFPDGMLAQECAAARMLLQGSGGQAQALLDELAGRLQANGVRGSPVAYLRGLINRAKAGTFIPELGLPIAAERRKRQLAAQERSAREAEDRRQEALRATPEYQARVRAEREKLSQLRDDMKQRIGTGKPP
jgi:hypothetical protein